MDENPIHKTVKDIPKEGDTVQLENVKFPRSWSFWESYLAKGKKLNYTDSMKAIYEWDNLIAFWQFWNSYPGAEATSLFFDGNKIKYYFNEQYRINAMNVFVKGVAPAWEDKENKGGKYLQLDYKIDKDLDKFFALVSVAWKKLMLNTMGQNIPASENINGVRFVDKTQFERGRIIMFRFEIWLKKKATNEKIEELKEYLKKELGCGAIETKNIE